MERDQFLKTLGISLAMVCAGTCLHSCGKKGGEDGPDTDPGTGGNKVSIDISSMAALGSQKTSGGVLFFRIAQENQASSFVATEAFCPHQGGDLAWQQTSNKIQCSLHAATYTSAGAVTSQPVGSSGNTRALKIYTVTLTGTTLTATKS